MKHLFLPLPIETVLSAWEDWRAGHDGEPDEIHLVKTNGGCFLVTSSRPPRVFVDLLRSFLSEQTRQLARAG
jgi:hypothetical protein